MRLEFSPQSLDDLRGILSHIAQEKASATDGFVAKLDSNTLGESRRRGVVNRASARSNAGTKWGTHVDCLLGVVDGCDSLEAGVVACQLTGNEDLGDLRVLVVRYDVGVLADRAACWRIQKVGINNPFAVSINYN